MEQCQNSKYSYAEYTQFLHNFMTLFNIKVLPSTDRGFSTLSIFENQMLFLMVSTGFIAVGEIEV